MKQLFWGRPLSQLLSGVLATYYGPRRVLAIMFAISGAGGLVFALSEPFVACLVGRALCGFGIACVMTSAFTLSGRWFSAESYPKITAVFFSCGGLGTYVGTAPLGYLSSAWGWRSAFLLLALVTLAYAVLVYVTVRDWPTDDERRQIGATVVPGEKITPQLLLESVGKVARAGDFWRLAIWYTVMSGMYFAFGGLWAAPYLIEIHKMTASAAGSVISMFSIGFIVGNPLMVWICQEKIHSYRLGLGVLGLLAAGGTVVLIFFGPVLNTPLLYLFFLCVGMSCTAHNAIGYAAARNRFGPGMTAITGGVFGCTSFLGGGALQMVCGAILEIAIAAGYSATAAFGLLFIPFIACGLIGLVVALTLNPMCDTGVDPGQRG